MPQQTVTLSMCHECTSIDSLALCFEVAEVKQMQVDFKGQMFEETYEELTEKDLNC